MHETYVKQILSPLASILVTHINIASIHKMCVMCGSNRWFTIPPLGKGGDFTWLPLPVPRAITTLFLPVPRAITTLFLPFPGDFTGQCCPVPRDITIFCAKKSEVPSLPRGGMVNHRIEPHITRFLQSIPFFSIPSHARSDGTIHF